MPEHAAFEAGFERALGRLRNLHKHVRVNFATDHRRGLQYIPAYWNEPRRTRQNRVPHCCRHRRRTGQHLGNKERISACSLMEGERIQTAGNRKRAHAFYFREGMAITAFHFVKPLV